MEVFLEQRSLSPEFSLRLPLLSGGERGPFAQRPVVTGMTGRGLLTGGFQGTWTGHLTPHFHCSLSSGPSRPAWLRCDWRTYPCDAREGRGKPGVGAFCQPWGQRLGLPTLPTPVQALLPLFSFHQAEQPFLCFFFLPPPSPFVSFIFFFKNDFIYF